MAVVNLFKEVLPSAAVAEASMGPEMSAAFIAEMTAIHDILLRAKAVADQQEKAVLMREVNDRLGRVTLKYGPHTPPTTDLRN